MISEQELNRIRSIRIHRILGIVDNGKDIMIKCPFHPDSTPSCVLYSNGGFHCFGCGKNGQNAIDFCINLGYTFNESLSELSTV